MPTASGRETAQEKRDRQHAERWAKIDAAVDQLPAGWAFDQATDLIRVEADMRTAGRPSYEHARSDFDTEVEAIAVARALKARGAGSGNWSTVFDMRGGPTVYRVQIR